MTSSPSLKASYSWLSGNSKAYNTVSGSRNGGGTGSSRRRAGLGIFDGAVHSKENLDNTSRGDDELRDLVGLQESDGWNVTVATEVGATASRGPRSDPLLTIYVSTPHSSLTLTRAASEISELDNRLRSQLPGRLPLRKSSLATTGGAPPATPPPKKRALLASLQRTLSPRRGSKSSLSSLSSSQTSRNGSSDSTNPLDTRELAVFLTQASFDPLVRAHSAWRQFFSPTGKEDLESARVERRIKRAKSDLTMHLSATRTREDDLVDGTNSRRASGILHILAAEASDTTTTSGGSSVDHKMGIDSVLQPPQHLSLVPIPDSKLGFEDGTRREASTSTEETGLSTNSGSSAMVDDEDVLLASPSPPTVPVASEEDTHPSTTTTTHSETPDGLRTPRSRTVSKSSKLMTIESFEVMKVLGKGCAGKVLLVRQRDSEELYALKAINKQHVLAHRELHHTRTEQTVLKNCSRDQSNPFVVRLNYSFHDSDTLYLALDFHPGGDLATQLARWGRLGRDRARFYTAEIVEGVEGLHKMGIIYRDLKPENILISSEGHVVLTDFGLSKDFGHSRVSDLPPPRPHWLSSTSARSVSTPPSTWMLDRRETTSTFCGTAEYLAPEVLLGEPYSYEVDAWSLGTMLYEMLAGLTPFWSEDHASMYRKVLHNDLEFDDEAHVFDDDTKSLLRGLLQRDPLLRMSDARIKKHAYFSMIEWEHVFYKRYVPPFIPTLNPLDPTDTSQFDDAFLSMEPMVNEEGLEEEEEEGRDPPGGPPEDPVDQQGRDVFDGYSYYGRDSASIHRGDEDETMSIAESEDEAGQAVDVDVAGDHTFSTTASDSTQATTAAHDSPRHSRIREREPSSQPSLAALVEDVVDDKPIVQVVAPPSITLDPESLDEDHSDSEWDVVETVSPAGRLAPTARNGGRETTLFARGFKDRYRLVVSVPRGSSSPLRPFTPSRNGSRKGSSMASNQSSSNPSPSTTPEPGKRPLGGRLGSMRSASSYMLANALRSPKSERSLVALGEGLENLPTMTSMDDLNDDNSTAPTSNPSSPRKLVAMKRLTFSAFRPSNKT